MLSDAEERRFDVIVAEDIDRLARRAEAAGALRALDIEVHTRAGGHMTKLHAGPKGLMGSLFLDNLVAHNKRGMSGVVLPERFGVMTTRSLTPHREEDGGRVDDGV